ncbi:MAG: hypothetical protein H6R01_1662 [Burkholderiaceae bacterium]|nr:hypothetical protein [Burkholderiaceae bacterium]
MVSLSSNEHESTFGCFFYFYSSAEWLPLLKKWAKKTGKKKRMRLGRCPPLHDLQICLKRQQ